MPRSSRMTYAQQIRQKGNNLLSGLSRMGVFGRGGKSQGLEINPYYGKTPSEVPYTDEEYDARVMPTEAPFTLRTEKGLEYWGDIQKELRKQLADEDKFRSEQKAKAVFQEAEKQELPYRSAVDVLISNAKKYGMGLQPSNFRIDPQGNLPEDERLNELYRSTFSAEKEKLNADRIDSMNRAFKGRLEYASPLPVERIEAERAKLGAQIPESEVARRTATSKLQLGYPEKAAELELMKEQFLPGQSFIKVEPSTGRMMYIGGSETIQVPESIRFTRDPISGKTTGGEITKPFTTRQSVVRPINEETPKKNTITIPDDAKLSTEGLTPEEIAAGIRVYQGKKIRPKQ